MILGTGQRIDAFRMALIGFVVLCLTVSSWAACSEGSSAGSCTSSCRGGGSWSGECCMSSCNEVSITINGTGQNPNCYITEVYNSRCSYGYPTCAYRYVICDTPQEADSAGCEIEPECAYESPRQDAQGNIIPGRCVCGGEGVPENCIEQYNVCMMMGGVWEKIGSDDGGCSSTCNICNSQQQIANLNRWNRVCCSLGKAPPPQNSVCTPPAVPSGYGMSMSRLLSKNGEESCGDLVTADGEPIVENAELFKRFCEDGEEYEESSDSNQSSSSSSEGEGESASSSADAGTNCVGEECLPEIYGVLDTIRDTLVQKLAPDVEGIKDCLYSFRLCAQLDSIKIDWTNMPKDSSWLHIDTTLLKYIKPLMDSSVALDSHQLKVLRNLDTNMLKQMRLDTAMLNLDSAMLRNDSSTRKAIVSGDSGIMKRVGHVDTSVRRLDSSLTKSIGTLDTSLTKSLGGIDTTLQGLDSSLNRGVRDGVDSLIDSMSKYIGRADSSIRGIGGDGTPLGDSLGKLIGILGGDTGSVGSGPYGDSANALGDSIRKWIREGDGKWDSAFRATEGEWGVDTIDGLYDSSFAYGTCQGDDCPPCTDSDCLGKITPSILKYGDSIAAQLGDSLVKNVKAQEDSLPTMWDSAMVKLREVSFFSTFDSTFLANIGAKIPNTNTCPEDCFRQDVNGRYAYVAYNMTLDWKLCRPIAPGVLNGLNAFDILKLLARVLTVVTCLFILMWEVSSRRGGGMGL